LLGQHAIKPLQGGKREQPGLENLRVVESCELCHNGSRLISFQTFGRPALVGERIPVLNEANREHIEYRSTGWKKEDFTWVIIARTMATSSLKRNNIAMRTEDQQQKPLFEPTSVRHKGSSPIFYILLAFAFFAGWVANDMYRGNTTNVASTATIEIGPAGGTVATLAEPVAPFQPAILFDEEQGEGTRFISGTVVDRQDDVLVVDVEYFYDGSYGDHVTLGVYPNMSNWSVSSTRALKGEHKASISIRSNAAVTVDASSLRFSMEAYKDNTYIGAIASRAIPYAMVWKKENSEEVIKKLAQAIPYSTDYQVRSNSPDHIQYIFDNPDNPANRIHSITIRDKTANRAVVEVDYSYLDVQGEKTRIVASGIVPGIPNAIGILSAHMALEGRHTAIIPISIFSSEKPKQYKSAAIRVFFRPIRNGSYHGVAMEKTVPYHKEWSGTRSQGY